MNRTIPIATLPSALRVEDAVEAACAADITFIEERLRRGTSVLVECDKDLSLYLYLAVRARLRRTKDGPKLVVIDGRPAPDTPSRGNLPRMLEQLTEAIRGSVDRTLIVLLHLDVLTTTHTGLTLEARESIPLLYENPEAVLLGFRDPSFEIPKVIRGVFPAKREITGIPREALPKIITQREARALHATEFDPFGMYKYVSGLNPVRLRRVLGELEARREAPAGRSLAQEVYTEIRKQTVTEDIELPAVDLDADIGGYTEVKTRLKEELIDLIRRKETVGSEGDIAAIESLLPRGVIFHGPPGTGKTYFAKAIATAINASVIIVSGPELKSKWVGESLPWEEEVLVVLNGTARRMPIGALVDGHQDTDVVQAWTASDDGRSLLAPVSGFLKHAGPDYVDVLVTETGREVRVTGGHSLFVEQEGRLVDVIAEDIEPGTTRVAVPLRLVAPETVRALDLAKLFADAEDMPAVLPLTDDLGEFLGRWVADGCYSRGGVRLANHAREVDHSESLCRRLFGQVTRAVTVSGGNGVDLVISSTRLQRLMEQGLEMPHDSRFKRVPPVIFLAPRPVVAAFLRGYFSGDGTFTGKFIEASTVSRGLASDVLTLLQYFGIAAHCRTKTDGSGSTSYRVRLAWSEFLRRFVEQIGFADEARNGAVREYVAAQGLRRKLQTPESHITHDVLWDLVVEKRREPYAREHVYDLSVPGTERFLAGFGNVLVHNSEENLRRVFRQARQSAPTVVVFDEIDAFAAQRGTYTGSGVEHSMVNQLLTEMDGFRKNEMVFVIATTNFLTSVDGALMRPGRFEFLIEIPAPTAEDRKAIATIYSARFGLGLSDALIAHLVRRTEGLADREKNIPFSGDHLQSVCRALKRQSLRTGATVFTADDIDRALQRKTRRAIILSTEEERVIGLHEAGHALLAMLLPKATPPERICISQDQEGALGYVLRAARTRPYVTTEDEMRADICVGLGGQTAERMVLGEVSVGAYGDLQQCNQIARAMVEEYGMSGTLGARVMLEDESGRRGSGASEDRRVKIDSAIDAILAAEQRRATELLGTHRALLNALWTLLLEKKVLEGAVLTDFGATVTGAEKGR